MSFKLLPDTMARYATYELAQLMGELTTGQRAAIKRIVQHVCIQNRPIAHLFQGDDKICAEHTYYRRGYVDEESGELRKAGWIHQPKFARALEMATRLALQADESEDLYRLRKAKRRAIEEAKDAVNTWVGIMGDETQPAKDRNDAAGQVLDLAFRNVGTGEKEIHGAASDWWEAAFDDG